MRRKKKLKQLVIGQMLAKQISVPEAQARWAWIKTGVYNPPPARPEAGQGAVVKSAGGCSPYDIFSDPQLREWGRREAGWRDMVAKGLTPGTGVARQEDGRVRVLCWGPGPDGGMGWQVPAVAPEPGPPFVPPGTAGR